MMWFRRTADVVMTPDLRRPVTPQLWDRIETNGRVAAFLVTSARWLDLGLVADRVREAK